MLGATFKSYEVNYTYPLRQVVSSAENYFMASSLRK